MQKLSQEEVPHLPTRRFGVPHRSRAYDPHRGVHLVSTGRLHCRVAHCRWPKGRCERAQVVGGRLEVGKTSSRYGRCCRKPSGAKAFSHEGPAGGTTREFRADPRCPWSRCIGGRCTTGFARGWSMPSRRWFILSAGPICGGDASEAERAHLDTGRSGSEAAKAVEEPQGERQASTSSANPEEERGPGQKEEAKPKSFQEALKKEPTTEEILEFIKRAEPLAQLSQRLPGPSFASEVGQSSGVSLQDAGGTGGGAARSRWLDGRRGPCRRTRRKAKDVHILPADAQAKPRPPFKRRQGTSNPAASTCWAKGSFRS